jgi:ferritin-like metal-binding protein YciE
VGSYRALIVGAQQMGQTEVVDLLNGNLREEEETARIAVQSTPELIRKALGQEGQQEEEDKGLVDKAKDKLTGR